MGCGSSSQAGAGASGPKQNGAGVATNAAQASGKSEHSAPVHAGDSQSVKASGKSTTKKERPWIIKETEDVRNVYEFDNVLGKGQFGTTRLAIHKKTGEKVACKSISKRKLTNKDDVEDVRREVEILYHLAGHPNVVQIKGVFEDTQYVHILMEVATGGELFDRIIARGHYSEQDASAAFRTMVAVIAHCHNMGVMHRDLKPENFLLSDKTSEATLKATDFGLSMFFKEGDTFKEIVGSAYYVAPEVLKRKYGKESDLWSLGVMLYILLSGVPPFYGETEAQIFQEVLTGSLDMTASPWPTISKAAKDLVTNLLVRDPTKRMGAKDILNNAWVRPDGVASSEPIQHEVVSRLQGFAAMNKLKKEALKIIVGFLPENEIKGLRELFHSIDTDNSGTITVAELKQALKSKGTLIPEADIAKLVDDTDVNGNGTIDYEEFLAATIHQSKLQQEEHLYKAFQVLDTDGSGFIDRQELIKALGKYGTDAKDLDTILGQVDTNDDGQIDYEEFCTMMHATAQLGAAMNVTPLGAPKHNVKDRMDVQVKGDVVRVMH